MLRNGSELSTRISTRSGVAATGRVHVAATTIDIRAEVFAAKNILQDVINKIWQIDVDVTIAEITARIQELQTKLAAVGASTDSITQTLTAQGAMQQARATMTTSLDIIGRLDREISDLTARTPQGIDLKTNAQIILKEIEDAKNNFDAACTAFTTQYSTANNSLITANEKFVTVDDDDIRVGDGLDNPAGTLTLESAAAGAGPALLLGFANMRATAPELSDVDEDLVDVGDILVGGEMDNPASPAPVSENTAPPAAAAPQQQQRVAADPFSGMSPC